MIVADIRHKQAKSILSKASGFIKGFDYTLNPYSGCSFACSYCYAAFFAPTAEMQSEWGNWVEIKENALQLLQKRRKRPMIDTTIYMSSVTDPYQPVERKLELTRGILEELLHYHQVRLVIQTRSPLVTRDIDLLREFRHAQVNVTVTTDDENVRKTFEPLCASIPQRMATAQALVEAGIQTCITMTPLLPVTDAESFARELLKTGAWRFVIQYFHPTSRRFASGTGEKAKALLRENPWTPAQYERVKRVMESILPNLGEGQEGFVPIWTEPTTASSPQ
jgi:DNA repair photolyase